MFGLRLEISRKASFSGSPSANPQSSYLPRGVSARRYQLSDVNEGKTRPLNLGDCCTAGRSLQDIKAPVRAVRIPATRSHPEASRPRTDALS